MEKMMRVRKSITLVQETEIPSSSIKRARDILSADQHVLMAAIDDIIKNHSEVTVGGLEVESIK